ncbi:PhzF family phenazine biosynthesis protein [Coccidioides immitis RS]|uniref:PhzF family phenazine biosynthesis protein n=1 Tax=Coccidioides immitis (strain RS) TaxID=246410 RepID=J3K5W7_COCIM|nr:PhzF family phenazine biosynthesis protein [Coccidioides immitis RS]EAS29883.3 PhzF family phenazine biosynthesis protein [Coccidioides immitis RS]TPX22263.1 hypothetical protein DIZ76_014131 [Coccidioides immitis]
MAKSLHYVTLDVFTTKRFEGNPLAVVFLEHPQQISQEQKQLIAREFNYSETIFVHPPIPGQQSRKIDIFTLDRELPFAGHPTIGATYWFLRSQGYGTTEQSPSSLLTKAGEIPISLSTEDSNKVAALIPHNVRIHAARMSLAELLRLHPELEPYLDASAHAEGFPVVSIVKGMSAVHVRLPSLEALGKITTPTGGYLIPAANPAGGGYLDEGWDVLGHVAIYFRVHDVWDEKLQKNVIRSRMLAGTLEDPATGSACSGMCSYLSLTEGKSATYQVVQGQEMGQRSEIAVRVELKDGMKEIQSVQLQGNAVKVAEGELFVGDE